MDNTYAMQPSSSIFLAAPNGLVGSEICRALITPRYNNLIWKSSTELDLCNQSPAKKFFVKEKLEYVFLAAAKVGGIQASIDFPAQFIYDNLMIKNNVMFAAYKHGVKKLLLLGSSCIYPRNCPQPIKEEYLVNQPLETSNECYALTKIAGLKVCQASNKQYGTNFISCMPTNLYGNNDNFNLKNSHAIPALIHKIYDVKINNLESVTIWGSGNAKRKFLYVDNLVEIAIFLMQNYNDNIPVNVDNGEYLPIRELINKIKNIIEFEGEIIFNHSKPDGTPQKLLDVSLINQIVWQANTCLTQGIQKTCNWYIKNILIIRTHEHAK